MEENNDLKIQNLEVNENFTKNNNQTFSDNIEQIKGDKTKLKEKLKEMQESYEDVKTKFNDLLDQDCVIIYTHNLTHQQVLKKIIIKEGKKLEVDCDYQLKQGEKFISYKDYNNYSNKLEKQNGLSSVGNLFQSKIKSSKEDSFYWVKSIKEIEEEIKDIDTLDNKINQEIPQNLGQGEFLTDGNNNWKKINNTKVTDFNQKIQNINNRMQKIISLHVSNIEYYNERYFKKNDQQKKETSLFKSAKNDMLQPSRKDQQQATPQKTNPTSSQIKNQANAAKQQEQTLQEKVNAAKQQEQTLQEKVNAAFENYEKKEKQRQNNWKDNQPLKDGDIKTQLDNAKNTERGRIRLKKIKNMFNELPNRKKFPKNSKFSGTKSKFFDPNQFEKKQQPRLNKKQLNQLKNNKKQEQREIKWGIQSKGQIPLGTIYEIGKKKDPNQKTIYQKGMDYQNMVNKRNQEIEMKERMKDQCGKAK